MIGLASTLGSQASVDLLLQVRADVHPLWDDIPPLIRAVWRAPLAVVQSLLQAKANMWQRIPVGALAALLWHHTVWHARLERTCMRPPDRSCPRAGHYLLFWLQMESFVKVSLHTSDTKSAAHMYGAQQAGD